MKRDSIWRWVSSTATVLLVVVCSSNAPNWAQEEPADVVGDEVVEKPAERAGRLVRIPVPITGRVQKQVEDSIRRVVAALPESEERPVLVLEFWPGQTEFGAGSEFGAA
ncbi:MAG: hypothetical protein MI757_09005, partial [Pirellulales bacterium]|nr:hypothetical protein [Pirellulales bacterium]